MDTIRKETLFSWMWRKNYKDNLPPPPPIHPILVTILYL